MQILKASIALVVCLAIGTQSAPKFAADEGDLIIKLENGKSMYAEQDGVKSNVLGDLRQALESTSSLETKLMGMVNDLEMEFTKLVNRTNMLEYQLENAAAKTCDVPEHDGVKTVEPVELIPGTTVRFTCNDGFVIMGSTMATCLSTGDMYYEDAEPKCIPAPTVSPTASPSLSPTVSPYGTSKGQAGTSCKDIWAKYAKDKKPKSGTYWIKPKALAFQVFCDMDTKTKDGLSGFTLCSKYDKNRKGNRYLANGFGRARVAPDDLKTLGTFTHKTNRWSSIDCRELINADSQWLMHAGTATAALKQAKANQFYSGRVRFTNIFDEVKKNPVNFFDTTKDDKGTCRNKGAGAVVTYNEAWTALSTDENNNLAGGECLLGSGDAAHMFCSLRRNGIRYSNAGTSGCGGSGDDTIYWAWVGDDHGCSRSWVLGNGCAQRIATWRYNYLFVF